MKTELSQQSKEGEQAEKDVLQEAASGPNDSGGSSAPPPPPAPAKPKKLEMGMTIEEVKAMMGAEPKSSYEVGAKTIYVYDAVKLTFVNGKLTDVK